MFGLDTKSLILGLLFGFLVLPMLMGTLSGKLASRKTATA